MPPTAEQIQLVIDAAQQHYQNDKWWAPTFGQAYFETNLRKAENRRKLGVAIEDMKEHRIAQALSTTLDITNHHNALLCPYCNPKQLKFQEDV
jgi:hypothetical protein